MRRLLQQPQIPIHVELSTYASSLRLCRVICRSTSLSPYDAKVRADERFRNDLFTPSCPLWCGECSARYLCGGSDARNPDDWSVPTNSKRIAHSSSRNNAERAP